MALQVDGDLAQAALGDAGVADLGVVDLDAADVSGQTGQLAELFLRQLLDLSRDVAVLAPHDDLHQHLPTRAWPVAPAAPPGAPRSIRSARRGPTREPRGGSHWGEGPVGGPGGRARWKGL